MGEIYLPKLLFLTISQIISTFALGAWRPSSALPHPHSSCGGFGRCPGPEEQLWYVCHHGGETQGGIPPDGSLLFSRYSCRSDQLALLLICIFSSLKLSNLAASADPSPDTLFTLQANISHFTAWQMLIDTLESNYPSDTLPERAACFDGTRQENYKKCNRWRVLAQAGLGTFAHNR